MIEEIRGLIRLLHIPSVVHIAREVNGVAHLIVSFVAPKNGCVVWSEAGPFLLVMSIIYLIGTTHIHSALSLSEFNIFYTSY